MRPLLYFFTFFILFACSDLTNNDFFGNKNDDVITKNSASTSQKDSIVYAKNVSPDGSWQININLKEGRFWGYSVVYNTGSIITKKINSGVELIGKMNNPKPKWLNDTTYKIQNIGATSNGYYELIIYKSAACKYIEHFKEKKDSTDVSELTEEKSTISSSENKEPEIINSYSQTDNFIVFTQTLKNYSNHNTANTNSNETSLSIVIQNYTDSFEYNNDELSAVKLNYSYIDGLNDISGDKPFKGYLKGKILPDNTWKIELDLWISTFSYVDNEKGKRQLKTIAIFKP